MIKSIKIKNFKCFKENDVKMNKANLLLGTNSGGKSSLIQALLLSKMSLECNMQDVNKSIDLITNNYGLNLYSFDEILFEDAGADLFSIELNYGDHTSIIEYTPTDDGNVVKFNFTGEVSKFTNELIYLSSDRSISRYQKSGDIHNIRLGETNEYLGYIIEKGRQDKFIKINKHRNHWEHKDTSILDIQINDWLDFILPKSRVTATNKGTDNHFSLLFGEKDSLHQTNVGYGISFVLPIIVAGLIADEGSVLIVENPELHLHPKAQSNIAAFLAVIAASGVQVVIETHSEHIVNGFRKAILHDKNPLKPSDLIINYFNVDKICCIEEIALNDKAEITHWPTGFMDQEENDLFEIRKMRLKK
ncbi:AAA family ATPase [Bacillus cereus]|uniref:AAA family ATPase n=1 Tax=Bacillus cereus TaxID=1396 RepID=UPI001CBFA2C6|nr:AAA family ATPase [Bacillus cereus]